MDNVNTRLLWMRPLMEFVVLILVLMDNVNTNKLIVPSIEIGVLILVLMDNVNTYHYSA